MTPHVSLRYHEGGSAGSARGEVKGRRSGTLDSTPGWRGGGGGGEEALVSQTHTTAQNTLII